MPWSWPRPFHLPTRTVNLAIRWLDQTCVVEAPSALERDVAALFPTLVTPGAHAGPPDVRALLREGAYVVESREGSEAGLEYVDAVSAVELAVTRHLMASEGRHCHLHASAALASTGRAVLGVGVSGAGKSTLAYAWYRLGLPVFGDDVIAVDQRGRLHPFPRPLKVDAARLRDAGDDPASTVAWHPHASDAWVDPTRGCGWAAGDTEVGILAEIRFVPGVEPRLTGLSGSDGLGILLGALHQTGLPAADAVDRLIRIAEGSQVYRLEFGDAHVAARLLAELAAGASE